MKQERNTPDNTPELRAIRLHIRGLVQGIGFRPFVYRMARKHAVKGRVRNTDSGCEIFAQGSDLQLDAFVWDVRQHAPQIAVIEEVTIHVAIPEQIDSFEILKSTSDTISGITLVSPDLAVCSDCLSDLKNQPHRLRYPLINCTLCGPRFSIIHKLPYDRSNTTMAPFVMCDVCQSEYEAPDDRRFHAQPVGCNHCGPIYSLHIAGKQTAKGTAVIEAAALLINQGKLLAIKGTGGYFFVCDAFNSQSVNRLRALKQREGKPFAVMFSDLDSLRNHAHVSDKEAELLLSQARPIVLLESKHSFPQAVSNGLNTVGAMLPYMPFHHLLFEALHTRAVVMTSGNLANEPVTTSDSEAFVRFGSLVNGIVSYNREIHNRVDDSVCMAVNETVRQIRRSRGYAPAPARLGLPVEGILATGAELTACFCLGKDRYAFMSQHIGDLQSEPVFAFYRESYTRLSALFQFSPQLVVHDSHPDYLSSRFAEELGIKRVAVQHHHAHTAACMAEYGLDEPVIGLSFDGTGYGTDGAIWGGEFLLADLVDFQRLGHFEYFPLPGGDATIKKPWKTALACLFHFLGEQEAEQFLKSKQVPNNEAQATLAALRCGINLHFTSSLGRVFDAVSSLLGLCDVATFQAEAPIRLEHSAARGTNRHYDLTEGQIIGLAPLFRQILNDIRQGVDRQVIAATFHHSVVRLCVNQALKYSQSTGVKKIVLAGGAFQNRLLLSGISEGLTTNGLSVYSPSAFPAGDAGIALGQLAVAAKRRNMGLL